MTPAELIALLEKITYKDWELRSNVHRGAVYPRPVSPPWIQWRFWATDNADSGAIEESLQSCRKWMLSWHMTESEVVRTAYKAALAAEEHECSENFLFNGAMLFNPHMHLGHLEVAIANGLIGDDLR